MNLPEVYCLIFMVSCTGNMAGSIAMKLPKILALSENKVEENKINADYLFFVFVHKKM